MEWNKTEVGWEVSHLGLSSNSLSTIPPITLEECLICYWLYWAIL